MNDTATSRYRVRVRVHAAGSRPALDNHDLIEALVSGGDSRTAVGRSGGTNKYLCPPTPAADLLCASSCTASPISAQGFQGAATFHAGLTATSSPGQRNQMLTQGCHDIAARLLAHFGATGVAEVILCPSGTDALLTAGMLMALERPGVAMTAILPQASETGAGVPRAARLRAFDGPSPSDLPLVENSVEAIEISLRTADGLPLGDDEIVDAYAAAAAGASGRALVYLTHGTKTGLIAPIVPPKGADVIVDACQARIEPATVTGYLRNGWPVVITGSKFFGGPVFSGAVLLPTGRFSRMPAGATPLGFRPSQPAAGTANIGMLLRWIAAIDAIDAFAPLVPDLPDRLLGRAAAIEQGLHEIKALTPIPGLSTGGCGWSDIPTIFTFAVNDPVDPQRRLTYAELRPLYLQLARDKVLLGQPVDLGRFGGLRIAVGARDFLPAAPADGDLPRLFAALASAVSARQTVPDQISEPLAG